MTTLPNTSPQDRGEGANPAMASLSPNRYQRIGPAWRDGIRVLADGQWHPAHEVIDAMRTREDPITEASAKSLIRRGIARGDLAAKRKTSSRRKSYATNLQLKWSKP